AAMGIVSGPTSELVGSLEAGGAEEIASTDVDVDAATDRSGLSAAFDTGTD
ncbi:argininosuccinate synthase, partial [Burkholderia multivorans]